MLIPESLFISYKVKLKIIIYKVQNNYNIMMCSLVTALSILLIFILSHDDITSSRVMRMMEQRESSSAVPNYSVPWISKMDRENTEIKHFSVNRYMYH